MKLLLQETNHKPTRATSAASQEGVWSRRECTAETILSHGTSMSGLFGAIGKVGCQHSLLFMIETFHFVEKGLLVPRAYFFGAFWEKLLAVSGVRKSPAQTMSDITWNKPN